MPATSTGSAAASSSPKGIWPNAAFADGNGINTLTGADPVAPFGGAAFHDNRVWIEAA